MRAGSCAWRTSLVVCVMLATMACTWLNRPLTGATLRAALDECKDNDLDVLVYTRPDQSVMAVRCIPKPEQVARQVRVRPHVPMKLLRPLLRIEAVAGD